MRPPSEHAGPDRQQDFGGLKMVVRFEVDARLPPSRRKPDRSRNGTQRTKPWQSVKSVPGTSARGDDAPPPLPTTPTISKPTLRFPHIAVIRAGSRVPQSHLIELKTYSRSGKAWSKSYPQIFLSQTPYIFYGAHRDGKFSEIKKYTLGEPHLEVTDRNAQVGFKKLKVALITIQELVGRYGKDGRISLVCKGKELRVYQREKTGSCLPKYALALFGS